MKQTFKARLASAKTTPVELTIEWDQRTNDYAILVNGLAQDDTEEILHELSEIGEKANIILNNL